MKKKYIVLFLTLLSFSLSATDKYILFAKEGSRRQNFGTILKKTKVLEYKEAEYVKAMSVIKYQTGGKNIKKEQVVLYEKENLNFHYGQVKTYSDDILTEEKTATKSRKGILCVTKTFKGEGKNKTEKKEKKLVKSEEQVQCGVLLQFVESNPFENSSISYTTFDLSRMDIKKVKYVFKGFVDEKIDGEMKLNLRLFLFKQGKTKTKAYFDTSNKMVYFLYQEPWKPGIGQELIEDR